MPSLAYMQGMNEQLDRQAAIKRLQMQDRAAKDQEKELKRKTDAARQEAVMRGMSQAVAESLGVGELEGFNKVQKEEDAVRLREEGRMEGERDQRAMAAAAQDWDTLPPSAKQFFVARTQTQPTMAKQVWDSIGMGGRARAFGVSHPKVLERADARDREIALQIARDAGDMARQKAKLEVEKPVREADVAHKKALTAQAEAQTGEAQLRTAKVGQDLAAKEEELARYRFDMERFGGKAEYQTVEGKLMYRNPGEKDWKPVGLSMDEIIMASRGVGGSGGGGGLTETGTGAGGGGGLTETGTGAGGGEAQAPKEVKRKTKDGKVAVFDAESKKFLRYE